MKKILAIIILHSIALPHLKAQNPNLKVVDSLKAVLASNVHDTVKYNTYCILAQKYWAINPSEGLAIAKKALNLSTEMNNISKMSQANGILGMNYVLIGDYKQGNVYLTKSLEQAVKIKDQNKIALASGALGNVYYFQSNYPQAIQYYLTALKASEQVNDKRAVAAGLSNIGAIYLDLKENDKALVYFERALKINIEIDFKNYQAINLMNINVILNRKKRYGEAKIYAFRALKINQEMNDIPGIASSYSSISSNYAVLHIPDSAYHYAKMAISIDKQINDNDDLAHIYKVTADVFYEAYEKNNINFISTYCNNNKRLCLQTAAAYADSSLQIAKTLGNLDRLAKSYESHSDIQMALGNCASALKSYKQYKLLNDSVYNLDVNNKLTQKTMQFDFDKKQADQKAAQEKKDAIARAEKEKSTQQKIVLIIGLIAALGFAAWDYRQKKIISKQKKRSDELLLNILPHEVAEELKAKGSADAQHIDEVTVLFTDFKGFTQLSEKLTPRELVAEINECFSAFDYIMEKHGVEKIKTIGDSYMAAGGLPTSNTTHAIDVVNAALDIQKFMQDHKAKKQADGALFFEIRIGVHTGPVVAGIVGVKKFAYDIWGDTVNTASRMESSGEVGKVNISGTTYELVKNKFNCVHRGKVQAKGKGEIDMYFVS